MRYRVPGAMQHGARRSDALQTRDPGFLQMKATGIPHLRRTANALHRVRDTR